MTLEEMRNCIDAAIAGKKIQRIAIKWPEGDKPQWIDINPVSFNFHDFNYRIKPEPREGWAVIYPTKEMADQFRFDVERSRFADRVFKVREVLPDE